MPPLTKKELQDRIAALEAANAVQVTQTNHLVTQINHLSDELEVATAEASVLSAERDGLFEAAREVDAGLEELHQQIQSARQDYQEAQERLGVVIEGVNDLVHETYGRLVFATTTLANILAYGGDDAEVVRRLAEVTWEELNSYLDEAQATGEIDDAFGYVQEQMSVGADGCCTCDACAVSVVLSPEARAAIFGDTDSIAS